MNTAGKCLLCGHSDVVDVFAMSKMPVLCNQLWPDRESAKAAPAADVDLGVCSHCGLVFNRSFNPDLMVYEKGYENALHYSPTFRRYAEELARHLVTEHGLAGKTVLEVGCGDGYMLRLLVEAGIGRGVGYDPSIPDPTPGEPPKDRVELVPEYFTAGSDLDADAVVCRHVLEHLPNPLEFVTLIRDSISNKNCIVYFEVPNGRWVIDSGNPWDVIYEHVTYWTEPALATLFRRAGFEPIAISTGFGGQFLRIEARPGAREVDYLPGSEQANQNAQAARRYGELALAEIGKWRAAVDDLALRAGSAVIWGAGSKGITFANVMGSTASSLAGFVDINPRKQGMVAPAIGLPVHGPDDLARLDPDVIFISNARYATEIRETLGDRGRGAVFHALTGSVGSP